MGINTKKMRAKNVVEGMQVQGVSAEHATPFLEAAGRFQAGGTIRADQIDAENVVRGLQWIGTDDTPELAELAQRVESLDAELRRLGAPPETAVAEVTLKQAAAELKKPQPEKRKVGAFLKTAAENLTQSVKTIGAATELGIKLKPLAEGAAKLVEVVGRVLGG